MTYTTLPWFQMLLDACNRMRKKEVAELLNVSAPLLSQVINRSGKYGTGEASTDKVAEKVLHTFGSWECPHLTEQNNEPKLLSPDECRVFAHRPPPIGSPRDIQHWQACTKCSHKAFTAPPVPRESKPRKSRVIPITKE